MSLQEQVNELGRGFVRDYFARSWPTWDVVTWRQVPLIKFPTDLWAYQEIIFQTRPSLILEAGTFLGGSARFFADVMGLFCASGAHVVSIDTHVHPGRAPAGEGVQYIVGSSTDRGVLEKVGELVRGERVMVVLDSDHHREHVLRELEAYAPLVTHDCYLVVEDTCVNGNPVLSDYGEGPAEALAEWLPAHPEFKIDPRRVKFGITTNAGGWLRRLA